MLFNIIMLSVISNSFICLSLGICLFPHCFIEVAGASRTMLNRSGERGHSSLVPNLGREITQPFDIKYGVAKSCT